MDLSLYFYACLHELEFGDVVIRKSKVMARKEAVRQS